MDLKVKEQKRHQQKHSGPKAEKKKFRKQGGSTEQDERKRNPKAFAVQSAVRMAKTFHRLVLPLLLLHVCHINWDFPIANNMNAQLLMHESKVRIISNYENSRILT